MIAGIMIRGGSDIELGFDDFNGEELKRIKEELELHKYVRIAGLILRVEEIKGIYLAVQEGDKEFYTWENVDR